MITPISQVVADLEAVDRDTRQSRAHRSNYILQLIEADKGGIRCWGGPLADESIKEVRMAYIHGLWLATVLMSLAFIEHEVGARLVAIGLASQSLIKDVINGLFILFEDSISVGDVARLRDISGVIEKITLRAVVLRDLHGDVHVIPNSSIDLVTNKTKVFSRYLLDVGIAYREDVDAVMNIMREVDEDMHKDMRYGYNMLEPIEMWGLDRFGDSAVYGRIFCCAGGFR